MSDPCLKLETLAQLSLPMRVALCISVAFVEAFEVEVSTGTRKLQWGNCRKLFLDWLLILDPGLRLSVGWIGKMI